MVVLDLVIFSDLMNIFVNLAIFAKKNCGSTADHSKKVAYHG